MTQKKLNSLSDLDQLLSQADRDQLQTGATKKGHDGKGKTVWVTIDAKGRKGKQVTLVEGLEHNPDTMEDIARVLKQHCGAGGTVKQRVIEIQGDQRQRVAEKLRALNYVVKQIGNKKE
jgi:translation initiation factor 1